MELWVGCIAGALDDQVYAAKLSAAGFRAPSVERWREYQLEDARAFLSESGIDLTGREADVDGAFASAFIRAEKPLAARCCATTCCA